MSTPFTRQQRSAVRTPSYQRHTPLNKRQERRWGLIFVTPIALQVILFTLVPVLIAVTAAFTNWNSVSGTHSFVGIDNFTEFLGDKYFWISVGNTIYMLIPIPFYIFLGILFALGSHRKTPGSAVFRILFFLPYVSSIVALVVMWKWIFNYQYGLANQALAIVGIQGPDWLGDPHWIKPTIVLMIVWKMIGITSIYILARLDGASSRRMFFQITLPMLTPAIFFLTVIGIIGSLQTFVEVQLFTSDGGQNYSAATITYYVWQKAFGSGELGLASAVAVLFALAILIVTLVQFRLSKRWVYEGE